MPNLLFALFPPARAPEKPSAKPSGLELVMTALERTGQAGCFVLPIFSGLRLNSWVSQAAFIAGLVCLLVYYGCWLRYFLSGRRYSLLFGSLLFIPLPMAVFPVALFFLSGFFLVSPGMFAASAVLAVGHFFNSAREKKRVDSMR